MARTVIEIGRLAGVSGATVSRALNNSGAVSAETRAAVFKVLQDSQYVRRRGVGRAPASKTRTRGSGLVEVVLHRQEPLETVSVSKEGLKLGPVSSFPQSEMLSGQYQLVNSFYRQVIDGAIEELGRWGRRAVVQNSDNLLSQRLLAELNGPYRDGILLFGERSTYLADFVSQCRNPLVLVDIIHDGSPEYVTSDNLAGITAAFEHLRSLGHTRIGFVGKLQSNNVFMERFNAFQLAMVTAEFPLRPDWIHEGSNHMDATAMGVASILSRVDRPTAFVCVNDCAAMGVLRAASQLGVSIPSDLSVIGFDDHEMAALVTPSLTTMRVPMAEMGRQAVRQLMIQIQGGATSHRRGCRVRLDPELVVRQSTARPPE